jgi:hypothetical protein
MSAHTTTTSPSGSVGTALPSFQLKGVDTTTTSLYDTVGTALPSFQLMSAHTTTASPSGTAGTKQPFFQLAGANASPSGAAGSAQPSFQLASPSAPGTPGAAAFQFGGRDAGSPRFLAMSSTTFTAGPTATTPTPSAPTTAPPMQEQEQEQPVFGLQLPSRSASPVSSDGDDDTVRHQRATPTYHSKAATTTPAKGAAAAPAAATTTTHFGQVVPEAGAMTLTFSVPVDLSNKLVLQLEDVVVRNRVVATSTLLNARVVVRPQHTLMDGTNDGSVPSQLPPAQAPQSDSDADNEENSDNDD